MPFGIISTIQRPWKCKIPRTPQYALSPCFECHKLPERNSLLPLFFVLFPNDVVILPNITCLVPQLVHFLLTLAWDRPDALTYPLVSLAVLFYAVLNLAFIEFDVLSRGDIRG